MSEHRWSGWPGAWCLDCGCEDPREVAMANGDYDDDENGMPLVRVTEEQMTCKEPGSKRHDPYESDAIKKRAEDWEVKYGPQAEKALAEDPKLAETIRDVTSRVRQAINDFQDGKYESMDEAMRAIGAKPMGEEDDDQG